MAYANVAHSGTLGTGSGAALSWTHSPTANNLLSYRAASFGGEISATGVTTSGGAGTFARDIGLQVSTDNEWASIHSLVSPASVTSMAMAAGPSNVVARFDEWSGNATASVLDTTASHAQVGQTTGDAGTLSTGASAGLCLAALNCDNTNSSAPTATGSGWAGDVNVGDASGVSTGLASKIISGSGSQQMTWTFGSTDYAAVSASYNAAATASTYPAWRRPRRITIPVRGLV